MILRQKEKFELIFKSEEQTHGFNMPYQVGKSGDRPEVAKTHKHKVENNDLIILATDGYIKFKLVYGTIYQLII